MKIYLINHDYRYAAEQIMLTMFYGEKPIYPEGKPEGDRVEISLHQGEKITTAVCKLYIDGKKYLGKATAKNSDFADEILKTRYHQRIIKLCFYRAALSSGKEKPVWGALTGIRPASLLSSILEEGYSEKEALKEFSKLYDVSKERAKLCLYPATASVNCEKSLKKEDICLYVGIPFCPTRCAYCSFVSQSTEKSMKLIPEFLKALHKEIRKTGEVVRELGLRPIALYLGGGTPTTLNPQELSMLFKILKESFDFSSISEITVEAGRPDTIDRPKLEVLKKEGVTRISVNPQTMSDEVLNAIGRKHSAQDVLDALNLVREVGGFEINMDLIAGLPLDSLDGFKSTLDTVLNLKPENITVHTLALKKGSRITLKGTPIPEGAEVAQMVDYANQTLLKNDFEPYYLYRQKYITGGLENIGWQQKNTKSIYNICIMEELCSIISMGGGASTKINLGKGKIRRSFDPKYPQEYIANIEKTLEHKEKIIEVIRENKDF